MFPFVAIRIKFTSQKVTAHSAPFFFLLFFRVTLFRSELSLAVVSKTIFMASLLYLVYVLHYECTITSFYQESVLQHLRFNKSHLLRRGVI